ncbi:MAG: TetR/AcrR family transcriptional regulator [Myxococcales bacterium]|nr:TetR/AcrR family transcriptional regulator [Myxococcales bacterium]
MTTRNRLVEAAAGVFNDAGYFGTDTNRLARAAGFAPGTFYKHFADKREIFLAAYARWVETELDAIRAAAGRRGRGRGRAIVREVLAHHRRWAGFRRSLRALAATDEVVRAYWIERRRAQIDFFASFGGETRRARTDWVYVQLTFERIADAIADGEAKALGASEASLTKRLEALLSA